MFLCYDLFLDPVGLEPSAPSASALEATGDVESDYESIRSSLKDARAHYQQQHQQQQQQQQQQGKVDIENTQKLKDRLNVLFAEKLCN